MLVAVGALVLRPGRIVSYTDQVQYALRAHNIVARSITLGERWPDHINFQYGELVFPYGYPLLILLPDGTRVTGFLECAKLERKCNVSVAELGLKHVKVPDIEQAQPWRLPGGLERYRGTFEALVNGLLS